MGLAGADRHLDGAGSVTAGLGTGTRTATCWNWKGSVNVNGGEADGHTNVGANDEAKDNGQYKHATTTNQAGLSAPNGDSKRPPALSKRARHEYCFYFDLLPENQHLMSSLICYVIAYGARYSAFLDVNVTHIITDKAKSLIQSSALVIKWGTKVLALSDFLSKIVDSYRRATSNVPPISPTLQRAAAVTTTGKRDLSHLLAEEKLILSVSANANTNAGGVTSVHGNAGATTAAIGTVGGPTGVFANPTGSFVAGTRPSRAITPLYNAAVGQHLSANLTTALTKPPPPAPIPAPAEPSVAPLSAAFAASMGGCEKKIAFEAFKAPFMMLEEISLAYAPLYKEYPPNSTGNPSHPILHYNSPDYHCPWVTPSRGGTGICGTANKVNIVAPPFPPTAASQKPVLVPSRGHRTADTLKRLLSHNSRPTVVPSEPRKPLALGLAPLPPLLATSTAIKPAPERPRPGYCECCYEKYSHLERHLQKDHHRRFARDPELYKCVDRIISTLTRPSRQRTSVLQSVVDRENYSQYATDSGSGTMVVPLSPAKSIISGIHEPLKQPPFRTTIVTAIPMISQPPLKNITNQMPTMLPASKMIAADAPPAIEIESDSPLFSSPSLKRRRSQRLVAKSVASAGRFLL